MKAVRIAAWFIALAVWSISGAGAADDVMSLQEAVSIGLRNNFDIQIAYNSAEAARNDTGRGTAGFLPTLDSLGNFSYDSTHYQSGAVPVGSWTRVSP